MENENTKQEYILEYDNFIAEYDSEQKNGEQVGIAVVKMVQHFIKMNMLVASTEIAFNKISAEIASSLDENTTKPISVAKAEILSKNTSEYSEFRIAKAHLINIEQAINSLKSLQKGIVQEFAYSGVQ